MKMLRIDKEESGTIFSNLSQNFKIVAPTEKPGKGRHSDTNLVIYDEVGSFEDVEFFKKTSFSAKDVVFPIRQTLFKFEKNKNQAVYDDINPTIVFLRACDINAMRITDMHFLKNGSAVDVYYQRFREKVKFILIECKESFDNCYCVSMGTNMTDEYAAFVRKTEDGYEIKVNDDELSQYFMGGREKNVDPIFVKKDKQAAVIPEKIDVSIFKHDMWKEYSRRCITCGRCNISCPTCTCFTVQDIPSEEKGGLSERRRIWSSCQVKNFSLLAGNHDFRISAGEKMRYKVLHKISDFKKRTGFHMCVGCGRCDDVCPEYISMFKCVEKINQIAKEVSE